MSGAFEKEGKAEKKIVLEFLKGRRRLAAAPELLYFTYMGKADVPTRLRLKICYGILELFVINLEEIGIVAAVSVKPIQSSLTVGNYICLFIFPSIIE